MVWTEEIVEKSTPEELVKMQLQEWAQTDAALAEKLNLAKIGECWDWITKEVRKQSPGKTVAAVWHGKIFRMARDWFVDGYAEASAAIDARLERIAKRKARAKARTAAKAAKAQEPAPAPAPEPAPAPVASPAPALQQLDLFAEGV